ncbi:MAG: hypothetical protein HY869_12100 [Chloroflexi bacterium]|nr:hypothetical protein [Chloroflexota bacterium]
MTNPKDSESGRNRLKFYYRGVCKTCNWAGQVRKWGSDAKNDAEEHKSQNSDHETEVIDLEIPDPNS